MRWVLSVIVVFIVVFSAVALIAFAVREEHQACAALGGHIVSKSGTNLGVGVGSDGGATVVVVPTWVSFCVSADGRILE